MQGDNSNKRSHRPTCDNVRYVVNAEINSGESYYYGERDKRNLEKSAPFGGFNDEQTNDKQRKIERHIVLRMSARETGFARFKNTELGAGTVKNIFKRYIYNS